jgi:hypothetical protein
MKQSSATVKAAPTPSQLVPGEIVLVTCPEGQERELAVVARTDADKALVYLGHVYDEYAMPTDLVVPNALSYVLVVQTDVIGWVPFQQIEKQLGHLSEQQLTWLTATAIGEDHDGIIGWPARVERDTRLIYKRNQLRRMQVLENKLP